MAGVLVLGLLFGAMAPSRADDAKHLTAILIVARSKLPDPYFSDDGGATWKLSFVAHKTRLSAP